MDEKIKEALEEINSRIPEEWKKGLMKTKVNKDEEFMAERALESPKISEKKKKKIRELLKAGKFRKEYQVLDEKIANKIDKFLTEEVAKAVKEGKLPDPATDPFIVERTKRIVDGAIKKSDPISEEERKRAQRLLN